MALRCDAPAFMPQAEVHMHDNTADTELPSQRSSEALRPDAPTFKPLAKTHLGRVQQSKAVNTDPFRKKTLERPSKEPSTSQNTWDQPQSFGFGGLSAMGLFCPYCRSLKACAFHCNERLPDRWQVKVHASLDATAPSCDLTDSKPSVRQPCDNEKPCVNSQTEALTQQLPEGEKCSDSSENSVLTQQPCNIEAQSVSSETEALIQPCDDEKILLQQPCDDGNNSMCLESKPLAEQVSESQKPSLPSVVKRVRRLPPQPTVAPPLPPQLPCGTESKAAAQLLDDGSTEDATSSSSQRCGESDDDTEEEQQCAVAAPLTWAERARQSALKKSTVANHNQTDRKVKV